MSVRLSGLDAFFLYGETASNPMHGTVLTVIEGEVPFETVFDHIASRLHLVPRYRQRLAIVPFNLSHPKWVDDQDFDLANHVKRHRLTDGATLDDAIAAALELHEPLLPRDRPLWRIYVLEGIENRTVLAQLGHHAMIDGASGVDISLVLFDLQKNAPPVEAEPWEPEPAPNPMELATEATLENMQSMTSGNFLQGLGLNSGSDARSERNEMMRRATESLTRLLSEPVISAPWNAGTVGVKRDFLWRKYPFGEFRRIRSVLGGTINDVVLATVSEAAARYLEAHGESIIGENLRIVCPVNVRTEDERGTLGNRVSFIFPLFSAEPMEMGERLRKVRWETEQIKNNREGQALQVLFDSMPSVSPMALAPTLLVGTPWDPTALFSSFPMPARPSGTRPSLPGFNFACTNVPGVQTTQYLAGHRVLDVIGFLMLAANLGFGIVICSYNQNIYFNFTCDRRLMPDLPLMGEYVDAAFSELLALADKTQGTLED